MATVLAIEGSRPRPRRGTGRFTAFLRAFVRDRQALAGLVIVAIAGGAAAAAPLIGPWDPLKSVEVDRLSPPGTPGHLLGTDEQGRDILSRLIWGGRISLLVGIVPTVAAGLVALLLGLVAGYREGLLDHLIMRVLDVFFAFPLVLLAIAIVGVIGPTARASCAPRRSRSSPWSSSRPFAPSARGAAACSGGISCRTSCRRCSSTPARSSA